MPKGNWSVERSIDHTRISPTLTQFVGFLAGTYCPIKNGKEESYPVIMAVPAAGVMQIVTPLNDHGLHAESSLQIQVQELCKVLMASVWPLQIATCP